MAIVFRNNATTALAGDITNIATSIIVTDGSKLPSITGSDYFYCTLDNGTNNEIVKVTAISGNTLTVVRAQDNTTARAFSTGDLAELRLTAAVLETFTQTDAGEITADEFIGDLRGAVIFKAKAGESLSKGDVVYVSGITGNTPVISKADADVSAKMPAFGLVLTAAATNASTEVVTFGTISGVDTSAFLLGDILYVSTTPGALTSTKPTGESALIQNIGKVQRSHASSGSIKVGGSGRTNDVPNLNDGNIFIGNGSNQATTASLNTKVEEYLDGGTSTPTLSTLNVSGNTTLTGDLTVNGTTTSLNTNTLDVEDKNITLNYSTGDSSASSDGSGITIQDAVNSTTDATILWDAANDQFDFSHGITLPDGKKAVFGTGSDLQIFHDGSHSYITDSGTGDLLINATNLRLRNVGGANFLYGVSGGSVSLYHSGAKKLETTSTGILVNGTIESYGVKSLDNLELEADYNGTSSTTYSNIIFKTDGNEVGRFDASGRLGLGTTSPTAPLEVSGNIIATGNLISYVSTSSPIIYGGSTALELKSNTGELFAKFLNNGAAELYYDNSKKFETTSSGVNIVGTVTSDGLTVDGASTLTGGVVMANNGILATAGDFHMYAVGDIRLYLDTNNNGADKFQVYGNVAEGTTTGALFTIKDSGNVGIGTDNPTSTLTVDGDATIGADSSGYDLTLSSSAPILRLSDTSASTTHLLQSNNSELRVVGSSALDLRTNNARRLYIGSGGDISFYDDSGTTQALFWDASAERLGIGTTSPTRALDVSKSGSTILANFKNTGGTSSFITLGNTTSTADQIRVGSNGTALTFSTNYAEVGRFSSNGYFGIGTSSPSSILHVSSDSTPTIKVTDTTNDVTGTFYANNFDSYLTSTSRLIFQAGGSIAATISASQKFGIGTTSPNANLHVLSSGNGEIEVERASGALINLQAQSARGVIGTDTNHELQLKTNGSGRMTINTAGNIGIGTTSPDTILEAEGATAEIRVTATTTNGGIGLHALSTNASTRNWDIRSNSSGLGTLDFRYGSSQGAAPSNVAMTMNSSGSVGIGTASPSELLTLKGSSDSQASTKIAFLNDSGGNNRVYIDHIRSGNDSSLAFGTTSNVNQANERLRINHNGNVGIATTSPSEKLHVVGGAFLGSTTHASDSRVTINGSVGGISNALTVKNSSASTSGRGTRINLASSNTEIGRIEARTVTDSTSGSLSLSTASSGSMSTAMFIDSSQRVGIGTTSPSAKITLADHTTAAGGIKFRSASSSVSLWSSGSGNLNTDKSFNIGSRLRLPGGNAVTDPDIGFTGASSGTGFSRAANDITFITAASERMRIDGSTGSLLVGTTSQISAGKLSVSGGTSANGITATTDAAAGYTAASFQRTASVGTLVQFKQGATEVGSIGTVGDDVTIGTGDTGLRFRDEFDAIQPHNITTNGTVDGVISLGKIGATFKDLHLSGTANVGGLKLGDNEFILAGTGSDLKIGHDGTDNIIRSQGPSLYIDANNHIFRGYSPYTEHMRIDSSGNVGIGTSSPSTTLELSNASTAPKLRLSNENNSITAGADLGVIEFYSGDDSGFGDLVKASISATQPLTSPVNGELVFKTSSSSTSLSEAMRISADGSVGIGTDSPQRQLHIVGSNVAAGIRLEADTAADATLELLAFDGNNTASIKTLGGNDALVLGTAGTEALRVDSSQNLLLGDTSTAGNAKFYLRNGSSGQSYSNVSGMLIDVNGTSNSYYGLRVGSSTGNSHLAVTNAGNVGIGTDSPATELHVSSAAPIMTATATNNASGFRLNVVGGSSALLRIQDDGTERMRLDASGNFLVGKTSASLGTPGVELKPDGIVRSTRAGYVAEFNRITNDGEIVNFKSSGLPVGSINAISGDLAIGTGDTGVRFHDGTNSLFPVNTTTNANVDDSISIGHSTARFKDLHLSGTISSGDITCNAFSTGLTLSGTPDSILNLNSTDDGAIYMAFKRSNDRHAYLGFGGGGDTFNIMNEESGGIISLGTSSTEAMRIDPSGNLLVGGTFYGQDDSFSVTANGEILVARASGAGRTMASFKNGGTSVGSITTTTTATTYNTSSDARLKDVTGEARGLEVITKLNPVAYNWKADGKADEGLIAQEVKELVPNAVTGSEDEHYQMDYSKLVTHLVKAVQELEQQTIELKEEIANLKGE